MSRREFLKNIGAGAAAGGMLVSQGAAAQQRPVVGYFDTPEGPLEERLARPWELTEAEWTSVIGRVRAGRKLKPTSWPDQSRFAVALSFDCDHEVSVLAGGNISPGRMAWGQRGHRIGVPRILDVLARHSVPSSFYIPAVATLMEPDQTRQIVADGHEIGMHGWVHTNNSLLDLATERELMLRTREVLEKVSGQTIVGHRSPNFDMSQNTIALVAEMGLEYDSSMMADDTCYEILLDGDKPSGLVEVPVEWVRDDAVYLSYARNGPRPLLSPEDVYAIFRRELEAAAAEGDLFELLMHPYVIGYRSRIWIMEQIIKDAKALGGAWFGTHAQVARWVRDHSDSGTT